MMKNITKLTIYNKKQVKNREEAETNKKIKREGEIRFPQDIMKKR